MNPKALNALAARVARIEALMENNDVFQQGGNTTYGGLQFEGTQFNINPLDQELANNYGFDANASTIFELQQRINELELLVAGGSRDVGQGGALDAGAAVGDDASDGTGTSGGIPTGYQEVAISLCVDGVSTSATILARF